MKSRLIQILSFVAGLVTPILIGVGMAETLANFLERYSYGVVSWMAVSFMVGLVTTWLPTLFLTINWRKEEPALESDSLKVAISMSWVASAVLPWLLRPKGLELLICGLFLVKR